MLIGFGLVIIGLYAFILGLEMGLFSLGETMAYQLTRGDSHFIIYAFGFAIGFATTMAEPSLTAIAKKAKEKLYIIEDYARDIESEIDDLKEETGFITYIDCTPPSKPAYFFHCKKALRYY